ncbi:hypothetical protein [Streptosporangium sp. NPDC000396]|uniref:hypothetical protein n=1 Tax=Streptosporangium sp. NPDC000396 TaxID=3366185 RepID=UPI00368DA192
MTEETPEPKTLKHASTPDESDSGDLVILGAVIIAGALSIAFIALMAENGEPPLRVTLICLVTALIGMALRLEAAIRKGPRQ